MSTEAERKEWLNMARGALDKDPSHVERDLANAVVSLVTEVEGLKEGVRRIAREVLEDSFNGGTRVTFANYIGEICVELNGDDFAAQGEHNG